MPTMPPIRAAGDVLLLVPIHEATMSELEDAIVQARRDVVKAYEQERVCYHEWLQHMDLAKREEAMRFWRLADAALARLERLVRLDGRRFEYEQATFHCATCRHHRLTKLRAEIAEAVK